MQFIDKAAISKLSRSSRQGYAVLLVSMASVLLYFVGLFGEEIFRQYQLDRRYSREGIQVEGVVTGFRYFQGTGKNPQRFTGYYPDVTFTSPGGPITLKASIGEPLTNDAQKQFWLGRVVQVRYLPEQPERGRVMDWHDNFASGFWVLSVFMSAVSISVLYFARVMWPPAVKTDANL